MNDYRYHYMFTTFVSISSFSVSKQKKDILEVFAFEIELSQYGVFFFKRASNYILR